jgi:hypothetical protein
MGDTEMPGALDIPEGVKAFNFWTILIMAKLWEEFPRPQWFHSRLGAVLVTGDLSSAGTSIGPEGQVQRFADTLLWLIDEGFARGLADAAGGFRAVSLTTRGFSVLNQAPLAIAEKRDGAPDKPLGTLMREAIVSQGVGTLATLIQRMVLPSGH